MAPASARESIESLAHKLKVTIGNPDNRPEMIGDIDALPELNQPVDNVIYSRSRKAAGLDCLLRPYQRSGAARILELKRLIVGDEPGLGKTAQAITAIELAKNAKPCLIICPSSLKINWQREITDWSGSKSVILHDGCKNNFHLYYEAGYGDYFIVNFESLKKYFVEKIELPHKNARLMLKHIHVKQNINLFKSVIIDESHRVKSSSAQQSKFTKGICSGKEYVIAMTGTPVVNRPVDLLVQLHIIDRLGDLGGWKYFNDRYCAGSKQASNLRELRYRLYKHCFYRREKKEVLQDLPAKQRQVVLCDINTRQEYNAALY